ncbi:MAG: glutamate--tRNA ligase [Candidatus Omnitrophica bacterium CG08_land_8_20_14_0_20_41_16]|uniref:Glutamate--tRNA ligase n=1 Tax=Candidatus Sherwoodlollariibacterium unditelluris TaxID=1974757 RepID=A0A2G9YKS0_9BACT|nr:MAG: glutamate--tRNA ligase [Candidatus Omnitrophica bacterium CG23_combo_of_CG06-09_8_20_14_all_41_10]PIS33521.1 MAG: glutamate--tRNA ligase [Candidatus Omnitrophica bacterium CG08_land_8_20_14_0_20_41_16]
MVRVRFAPSPTGNLHIGGGRTALFNWLYARAKDGKFILRLEDTDKLRSQQEFVDEILNSLKWLGFNWDEIYYQSQRFNIYREQAEKLLKSGLAYTEKLPDKPGEAIIFKVPQQKIKMQDLIHSGIEFDTAVIKDQVLIKSDGTPTYNFACVVDDATMDITHVIRGDDHISNTPKQVLLYEALGFKLPKFAHLPLIMNIGGGRLSKRTGATAISEYRLMGYLAPALVNYLLLLSWSPGENRELIDIKEAIKLFDLTDVNKTAATFDLKKLGWINNQYLKNADSDKLADEIIPMLIEKNYIHKDGFDRNYLVSIVKLFQPRLLVVNDFADWADFFFLDEPNMDPAAEEKYLKKDLSREFTLFIERLDALKSFDIASIEESFRGLISELGIESKALIHPIRVALTGKTIGPGLFEVIYYLGKERTKERLSKFIK